MRRSAIPKESRRGARPVGRVILFVALSIGACGCLGLGASRFYEDQLGFSRALGEGEKSATLLNVVRIRYGDSPTFLQPTQVISGYQLQRSVTGGFEVFPAANPSTFLSGGATAQLQESPTFTFQPLSGEQFARSFVQPLSSADLLPLAMSGMPIDVLFRLGVQSVNGYSNAVALTQTDAAGSPEFFQLLHDLRRLQIAGLLNVRISQTHIMEEEAHDASAPERPDASVSDEHSSGLHSAASGLPPYVYLSFTPSFDPALTRTADEAKRLMNVAPQAREAEVIYGRSPEPGQVAVITRSVLGVMSQLAIQIDVPTEDIAKHRTLPTVGNSGPERRPVVIIHSGNSTPPRPFTCVRYVRSWYWIDENDFDSKLAFTVLQVLLALARTGNTPGAILTIPAH